MSVKGHFPLSACLSGKVDIFFPFKNLDQIISKS